MSRKLSVLIALIFTFGCCALSVSTLYMDWVITFYHNSTNSWFFAHVFTILLFGSALFFGIWLSIHSPSWIYIVIIGSVVLMCSGLVMLLIFFQFIQIPLIVR